MSTPSSFTVQVTDMPSHEVAFIQDAASILFDKVVSRKKKRFDETEFVQSLKLVLDQRFGPQWTVIAGLNFGFALKNRKKSAVVLNGSLFGKKLQVVAYRSPGHEVLGNAVVAAIADRKLKNQPVLVTDATQEISALVRQEATTSKDLQASAQAIRDAVSAATEKPIWHVIVGDNFRVAFPESRTDEINVALEGGSRALLFRHQQESERKFVTYLPVVSKVLMIFFCLGLLFQTQLGLSDSAVQVAGVIVLTLAVMKVLYAVLFERKQKQM